MEKLIITILFFIISMKGIYAQNNCIGASIELGTVAKEYQNDRIMYTDIFLNHALDFKDFTFKPYGAINTWFIQNDERLWRGSPIYDVYYVGLGIEYYNILFNINHFCSHSTWSNESQWEKYNIKREYTSYYYYTESHLASNSSIIGMGYQYSYKYLNIQFMYNRIIESKSYNIDIKSKYQFSFMDTNISIFNNNSFWRKDNRLSESVGTEVSYMNIYMKIEYNYNNKLYDAYMGADHFYNEYALDKNSLIFSIGYSFD
jgi:hypothetical protein